MPRCIIVAPLYAGEEQELLCPKEGDMLLCADGGLARARAFGLVPQLVVGDLDSMPPDTPLDVPLLRLPEGKDDTDMAVCLNEGRKRGYTEFVLAGCLGGRFDHTVACLQCAADCALRGEKVLLVDGQNRVTILPPGKYQLSAMPGRKLSLLAYTPQVHGVTITGTRWELHKKTLLSHIPLGCSNEFTAPEAALSFTEGLLMVCYSADLSFVEK